MFSRFIHVLTCISTSLLLLINNIFSGGSISLPCRSSCPFFRASPGNDWLTQSTKGQPFAADSCTRGQHGEQMEQRLRPHPCLASSLPSPVYQTPFLSSPVDQTHVNSLLGLCLRQSDLRPREKITQCCWLVWTFDHFPYKVSWVPTLIHFSKQRPITSCLKPPPNPSPPLFFSWQKQKQLKRTFSIFPPINLPPFFKCPFFSFQRFQRAKNL